MYRIARCNGDVEPQRFGTTYEEADMRSDAILLIDDPEPDSGICRIEARQHCAQIAAVGGDLRRTAGVGTKRARDPHGAW